MSREPTLEVGGCLLTSSPLPSESWEGPAPRQIRQIPTLSLLTRQGEAEQGEAGALTLPGVLGPDA
eukprot:6810577-Prymnesium_polylepis.1